jgi:hypothetical protein
MAPKKSKKQPDTDLAPAVAAPVDTSGEESNERFVPGASDWEPAKIYIRPRDQLSKLTDKQLAEEFTKIMRADNPEAPKTIVRFSHKEKMFKLDATVDQTTVHYLQEGVLLHTQSDEAKKQKEKEDDERTAAAKAIEAKRAEAGPDADEDATQLRNQFNFSERASQTLNNAMRERGTMTEPPPSVEYSSQCTQVSCGYSHTMRAMPSVWWPYLSNHAAAHIEAVPGSGCAIVLHPHHCASLSHVVWL